MAIPTIAFIADEYCKSHFLKKYECCMLPMIRGVRPCQERRYPISLMSESQLLVETLTGALGLAVVQG